MLLNELNSYPTRKVTTLEELQLLAKSRNVALRVSDLARDYLGDCWPFLQWCEERVTETDKGDLTLRGVDYNRALVKKITHLYLYSGDYRHLLPDLKEVNDRLPDSRNILTGMPTVLARIPVPLREEIENFLSL